MRYHVPVGTEEIGEIHVHMEDRVQGVERLVTDTMLDWDMQSKGNIRLVSTIR